MTCTIGETVMSTVHLCPNPRCRTENPADHAYCYECGSRLPAQASRAGTGQPLPWPLVTALLFLLGLVFIAALLLSNRPP